MFGKPVKHRTLNYTFFYIIILMTINNIFTSFLPSIIYDHKDEYRALKTNNKYKEFLKLIFFLIIIII